MLEAAGIEDTFPRESVEQCLNLLRRHAGRQEGRPTAALVARPNDAASAQRIISAILAGERDAATLARMRDHRCRTPEAKVIEALHGDYRAEYLFVLHQCQERWEQTGASIAACDAQISLLTAAIGGDGQQSGPLPTPENKRQHTTQKHSLAMPIFEEGWRFYGVDLSAVPGVGSAVLATLMSELGTGTQIKGAFRSAEAFASWLGLCPDNRVSGGKVLKAKTRKVVSRVAAALRIAAQSLRNSEHKLGEYCRRMKARLGKAEGITATAHKLARILYAVITRRVPYNEDQAFKQTPATQARRLHHLQKQAPKLGLQLIPAI